MSGVVVYTLPVCPNCDMFKTLLHSNNVSFETKDLEDDDVRMELLMDSVTLVEAPIIRVGDQYFDSTSALGELGINV